MHAYIHTHVHADLAIGGRVHGHSIARERHANFNELMSEVNNMNSPALSFMAGKSEQNHKSSGNTLTNFTLVITLISLFSFIKVLWQINFVFDGFPK